MDARSIAATAANGGVLTSAEAFDCWENIRIISLTALYIKREYTRDLIRNKKRKNWYAAPILKTGRK